VTIELRFSGPFPIAPSAGPSIFEAREADGAGIYLWSVQHRSGQRLVTYVGETGRSFADRTEEHVRAALGGYDTVYDAGGLEDGVKRVVWPGLWGPRKSTTSVFLQKADGVLPAALAMLRAEMIYLAPLDGDRRLRERIEAGLAAGVQSLPQPGSAVLQDNVRYRPRRQDESPFDVAIHSEDPNLQLPARVMA
jgi:hypothetical protein